MGRGGRRPFPVRLREVAAPSADNHGVALRPDEYHAVPGVGDGRPAIADIHGSCDALLAFGWRRVEIAAQVTETGESLPIPAYLNSTSVDRVLIGGIHGREPAGAIALARYAGRLAELGRGQSILLLPLLNPWGYSRHLRYGPSGQSVSDSDHLLGRATAPACPEAAAITSFVLDARSESTPAPPCSTCTRTRSTRPRSYHLEGHGSYLYVSGDGALEHPVARRVYRCLEASSFPLIKQGVTRFGERLVDGVIVDTEDGSIDELLAKKRACCPVITTEIVLHAETTPPLVGAGLHLPGRPRRLLRALAARDTRPMCTTVVVGRNRSATGSVLVAHSEELGRNSAHKVEICPRRAPAAGESYPLFSGGGLPQPRGASPLHRHQDLRQAALPGRAHERHQRARRRRGQQHGPDARGPGGPRLRRRARRHHLDRAPAARPGARALGPRRRRARRRALRRPRPELRLRDDGGGRRSAGRLVGGAGSRRPMGRREGLSRRGRRCGPTATGSGRSTSPTTTASCSRPRWWTTPASGAGTRTAPSTSPPSTAIPRTRTTPTTSIATAPSRAAVSASTP